MRRLRQFAVLLACMAFMVSVVLGGSALGAAAQDKGETAQKGGKADQKEVPQVEPSDGCDADDPAAPGCQPDPGGAGGKGDIEKGKGNDDDLDDEGKLGGGDCDQGGGNDKLGRDDKGGGNDFCGNPKTPPPDNPPPPPPPDNPPPPPPDNPPPDNPPPPPPDNPPGGDHPGDDDDFDDFDFNNIDFDRDIDVDRNTALRGPGEASATAVSGGGGAAPAATAGGTPSGSVVAQSNSGEGKATPGGVAAVPKQALPKTGGISPLFIISAAAAGFSLVLTGSALLAKHLVSSRR